MNEDLRKIESVGATPPAGATPSVISLRFAELREYMLAKHSAYDESASSSKNYAATLNGFKRSFGLKSEGGSHE